LKPENLLFDRNFNLKITDFGYSTYLAGKDGTGLLKTHLGSESYMAPEIHANEHYSGVSIDLFACGIVLFILKSQNPPFQSSAEKD
jgi:serine/threonine protein kinase